MVDPSYQTWMGLKNGQYLADRLYAEPDLGACEQSWRPLPQAWYSTYDVRGSGEAGFQHNRNWTLQQNDYGAFSFTVESRGSGVAIDLGGPLSDVFGYVIVLDGPGHRSFVLRKHVGGSQPIPGGNCLLGHTRKEEIQATVDPSFRLNPDYPNHIWVVYSYGAITVGVGETPGVGPTVLVAQDPHPAPGIQQFALGKWGTRSGDTVITVRDITSYKLEYGRPSKRPYNCVLNAPHYFQCWRAGLYYR